MPYNDAEMPVVELSLLPQRGEVMVIGIGGEGGKRKPFLVDGSCILWCNAAMRQLRDFRSKYGFRLHSDG